MDPRDNRKAKGWGVRLTLRSHVIEANTVIISEDDVPAVD
jgi:hypothetical protein